MKKLALTLLLAALVLEIKAQDNPVLVTNYVIGSIPDGKGGTTNVLTQPELTVLSMITANSTNFFAGPFLTYWSGGNLLKDKIGGGVVLGYKVSDFFASIARMDYIGNNLYMPSFSAQLSFSVPLFGGKYKAIPFTFGGIAVPLGGAGSENNTAVGIVGTGLAVPINAKNDIAGDVEIWSGFGGYQYRIGWLHKF